MRRTAALLVGSAILAGALAAPLQAQTAKPAKKAVAAEPPPAGKAPATVKGDATYVPEMDAVLTVSAKKLWFYKCAEKKWYTAPSTGDPFRGENKSGRDNSPIYDPGLKVVVRFTPTGFHQWVSVHVMRLDPKSLKLTPVE